MQKCISQIVHLLFPVEEAKLNNHTIILRTLANPYIHDTFQHSFSRHYEVSMQTFVPVSSISSWSQPLKHALCLGLLGIQNEFHLQ